MRHLTNCGNFQREPFIGHARSAIHFGGRFWRLRGRAELARRDWRRSEQYHAALSHQQTFMSHAAASVAVRSEAKHFLRELPLLKEMIL